MIVKLDNAGIAGLVYDLPAYEIPDQAWSSASNVRFRDGFAERTQGYAAGFGTPEHAPYGAFYAVSAGGTKYIVYPGLAKIRAVQGTTHYDITRSSGGDYTGTADDRWTGGVLTGIVVVSNGKDVPQFWTPQNGGNMAILSNWPTSATTTCKFIRPFRDYLIAGNITKGSTVYPYLVKWSAAAAAGSLPTSWDETDTTNDAGEYDLGDSTDKLIDGFALGDSFILYREESIHAMRWVGGQSIMAFQRVSGEGGVISQNCVGNFPGGHLVFGQGDVYIFNGSPNLKSIVDGRMRRWLFSRIDSTYFRRSFVVENWRDSEIWACFPETGNTACSLALVWNYKDNTLAVRDLPSATCGVYCQIDQTSPETWSTGSEVWTDGTAIWDSDASSLAEKRLVIGTTASKLQIVGAGFGADGSAFTSQLERTGIALGDPQRVKYVREVWPKLDGTGSVEISVGTSMNAEEPYTWGAAQTFTIGTTRKVDVNSAGRFLGLRIRSNTATNTWRLKSAEVDVQPMGRW